MRAGDTDGGGEATARVLGSTIGMALRLRWARGAWIFVCCATDEDWLLYEFELKLPDEGGRRKLDEGWIWCCKGECSGEPLDSDDRSDPAE